jgi:hypothetical protein
MHRRVPFRRAGAAVGLALWVGFTAATPAIERQVPARPTVPQRVSREPAPAGPPELPAEALSLRPLTLEARGLWPDGTDATVYHVTRTADRVHVRAGPTREWFYARNPVDPRRVSGVMVDTAQRVLVSYEESDLRNVVGIRGWLDVITLGVDLTALEGMDAAQESRVVDRVAFTRFTARGQNDAISDVWWSQSHLLPLRVVSRGTNGTPAVRLSVVAIRDAVDEALLQAPAVRFPGYREIGYADWLEKHGDHGEP